MTLLQLDEGARARVLEFTCNKELKLRLESLALYEGAAVEVVNRAHGCIVVNVLNTRVALSNDAADSVIVIAV